MPRKLAAIAAAVAVLATLAAMVAVWHGWGRARPSAAPGRSATATPPPARPSTGPPCAENPQQCGFPGPGSTGVPATAALRAVPGQVTRGPGWSWVAADREVAVTGSGATLAGLSIRGTLNIAASHVTVNGVRVISDGGSFAVSLRHTADVTIENSTVGGANSGPGRVGVAIGDVYGDSAGMVISGNDISGFKTGIQVTTGQVTGNYIHDPGYVPGDHTNGILDLGTTQPLVIRHNTILISLSQTDAISLDATTGGTVIANKTITGNLLGGGSYTIYGGGTHGNATRDITISGNVFSQQYYPSGGQFGAAAYVRSGPGNAWTANRWDATRQDISFADGAVTRCEAPACVPPPAGGVPAAPAQAGR